MDRQWCFRESSLRRTLYGGLRGLSKASFTWKDPSDSGVFPWGSSLEHHWRSIVYVSAFVQGPTWPILFWRDSISIVSLWLSNRKPPAWNNTFSVFSSRINFSASDAPSLCRTCQNFSKRRSFASVASGFGKKVECLEGPMGKSLSSCGGLAGVAVKLNHSLRYRTFWLMNQYFKQFKIPANSFQNEFLHWLYLSQPRCESFCCHIFCSNGEIQKKN